MKYRGLYCIPHETQLLGSQVSFQKGTMYHFVETTDGVINDYVTIDESGDEHYADREWLSKHFEIYEDNTKEVKA